MKCELAEELTSAANDEALSDEHAAALAAHQQSCASCRAFSADLAVLRQRLRVQPLDRVPEVTAGVRARLEPEVPRARVPTRMPTVLRAAAAFLGAFVVSALIVAQLAPTPVLAQNLGQRVLAAQAHVTAMSAVLSVVERGWHPDVTQRHYEGTFAYAAPESLRVQLEDRSAYPSPQWLPNHIDWLVDGAAAASTGLRPCPPGLQPACSASGPRTQRWHGRAPFDADVPAPLDLVVPANSFALTGPVADLGIRTIGGEAAIGVRVTAAQAAPLLDGILRVGNWRGIHHSDVVEVWLHASSLTPVAVDVLPADTAERRLWAGARGLADAPGEAFLQIVLREVRFGAAAQDVRAPARFAGGTSTDAGFRSAPTPADAPVPAWLPEGVAEHRSGRRGDTIITTWSDGRAWLRVESTRSWEGDRLFGGRGELVRPVQIRGGTAYLGIGGTTVHVHTQDLDVALHGSYGADVMLRIARSLPVTGEPVPPGWAEGAAATVAQAAARVPGLMVAGDVPGFADPAVRVDGMTARSSYVGAGTRGFLLTQAPGEILSPPFDADVLSVPVRDREARFTPSRGVLEWVEAEHILSLESASIGVDELVAIAERLERYP